MKMNPTSLLRVVVVLAVLGSHASARVTEQTADSKSDSSSESRSESSSSVTIEVNGKKVQADGSGGTITIRTDGDNIEIDTDGDGEAEESIEKEAKSVAWLGVKTNEVSPELASQLDIEGGAVVELVVPGSPADEAGLQDHDIITAIGETGVSDPEELAAAIRACKPGTETNVSVLRKAKELDLTATLGERPAMPAHKGKRLDLEGLDLHGDADEIRKRIEKIQKEMLEGFDLKLPNLPGLEDLRGADIVRMSSKTTTFSDGDGTITITTKDGETQIEAKDADGNLLYKGPAETEDDRKKLPKGVLEKLERFEAMNVDIDIKGFEDKLLPPALDVPKLKPAKPKKRIGSL